MKLEDFRIGIQEYDGKNYWAAYHYRNPNGCQWYHKPSRTLVNCKPLKEYCFANKGALITALKAFIKRHNAATQSKNGTLCIGDCYTAGKLYLVGYKTGHKDGREIEFLSRTFTNPQTAMQELRSRTSDFTPDSLRIYTCSFSEGIRLWVN